MSAIFTTTSYCSPFALEARDLAAAEHGLERAAERVDLDADRRRLLAVDRRYRAAAS